MADYLAVDTSSKYLTVLAVKGGKEVLKFLPECAMKHSVILMDEIGKALDEAGLTPRECGFFAVITGPGSFTGIRIGIATVKGFAAATGKPVKGVTAFSLIAYNVNSNKFLAAIDAAHGHYYAQVYENGEPLSKPEYLSFEEVNALGLPVYGFEDLPLDCYTKLEADKCLKKAVELSPETGAIHALYVRKSQAEENADANKKLAI